MDGMEVDRSSKRVTRVCLCVCVCVSVCVSFSVIRCNSHLLRLRRVVQRLHNQKETKTGIRNEWKKEMRTTKIMDMISVDRDIKGRAN
jgi:cell division protein FtsL